MSLISLHSIEYHVITTIILIIAIISFFQFRLSKNRKSKIPGLILPILFFVASIYLISIIDFKKDAMRILIALLLLFNIPTFIMLYVYKDGRKKRIKEEEKRNKVNDYVEQIENKNRNKDKNNTKG